MVFHQERFFHRERSEELPCCNEGSRTEGNVDTLQCNGTESCVCVYCLLKFRQQLSLHQTRRDCTTAILFVSGADFSNSSQLIEGGGYLCSNSGPF